MARDSVSPFRARAFSFSPLAAATRASVIRQVDVIGLDAPDGLDLHDRLVQAAGQRELDRPEVPDADVVRVPGDGQGRLGGGLFESPQGREALGDLGDRLRVLGHEPGRALQMRDGLPVEPDAPQEGPDVQVDDRVAGLEPERPGEELEGLGEIAPVEIGPAEADVRFGGIPVLVEGLLVIVAHPVDVPGIPELRRWWCCSGIRRRCPGPTGPGRNRDRGPGPARNSRRPRRKRPGGRLTG